MSHEQQIHRIASEAELAELAQKLLDFCGKDRIVCFDAPMGAGKTTFIKQVCAALGYNGLVNSPTFPIISCYPANPDIYHVDCYRLKDEEEAIQIGIEDYLESGNFCFIEWSSLIKNLVPSNVTTVTIAIEQDGHRTFVFQKS